MSGVLLIVEAISVSDDNPDCPLSHIGRGFRHSRILHIRNLGTQVSNDQRILSRKSNNFQSF